MTIWLAVGRTSPLYRYKISRFMAGIAGTKGVDRVCTAHPGANITFEFHSWPGDKLKPVLDPSHKGPCAVYMKKVDSAIRDRGTSRRRQVRMKYKLIKSRCW